MLMENSVKAYVRFHSQFEYKLLKKGTCSITQQGRNIANVIRASTMVGLWKGLRKMKRFMFISTIVDTHFMSMWHEEVLILEPLYKFNTFNAFVKKDIL